MYQEMSDLYSVLNQANQGSIGWLTQGVKNIVNYKDPIVRKRVQSELDELVEQVAIIHLFTLFESSFEEGNFVNGKSYDYNLWKEYMTENSTKYIDDFEKFLAFRHIRHTVTHNAGGQQAIRNKVEFDAVQARSNVNDRIKNVTIARNIITVQPGIVQEILNLMKIQVGKIMD